MTSVLGAPAATAPRRRDVPSQAAPLVPLKAHHSQPASEGRTRSSGGHRTTMSNLTSMSATPAVGRLVPPPSAPRAAWRSSRLWAVAAAVWPLTGTVVPWDSKNHFYPMLRYLGAALAHGELPLWNPYHFSGHPSVADPQSLLFTPTMLLFGWLVPQPSMQLFDAGRLRPSPARRARLRAAVPAARLASGGRRRRGA